MKLQFKIFGFEIASLELELPAEESALVEAVEAVVDPLKLGARATKWISRRWVRGMLA